MNQFWRRLTVLSAGLLLAASSVVTAQSATTCAKEIVVQPGDTLATLADQYLGNASAYGEILAATNAQAAVDSSFARITNPNVIGAGWKLCLSNSPQSAANPVSRSAERLPTQAAASSIAELTPLIQRIVRLSIPNLRSEEHPGSVINLEETLSAGPNYDRYLASYLSEGLKIYALMTVPTGPMPPGGWPVIVFNHGYMPPDRYQSTGGYAAHIDAFARHGYIVFRPDYRGYGNSEGEAAGGYDIPNYTVDVLNAVAALQQFPQAAPHRIGMWGHSLGGTITLYSMVSGAEIKAGVIWAGVVGSYPDLLALWERQPSLLPTQAAAWRDALLAIVGTADQNPTFWNAISPTNYLADLSGPLQLHHGSSDESVPAEFSRRLAQQVQAAGKTADYYEYPGDDHTLSLHMDVALERSLAFFDYYLKPKG
jgi:dienelactone hydrolase